MDTNDLIGAELNLFEKFVDLTDDIWWLFENHPVLEGAIGAAIVLCTWLVFRYHFGILQQPDFFLKNIPIAGRFCKPAFDAWRMAATAVPPIGLSILIFVMMTRGKTEPFIATFGIKGAGKRKELIIRRAVRDAKIKR